MLNLAAAIVPEDNWLAFKLVRFAPEPPKTVEVNKPVEGL